MHAIQYKQHSPAGSQKAISSIKTNKALGPDGPDGAIVELFK